MVFAGSLLRAAFAAVLALVGATAAHAHTHLDRAVPAAGRTVRISPQQIELSFSETLESAFSTIEVTDEKGNHVEQGDAQLDPDSGRILRVQLMPITSGTYKVVWRVVSVDTHRAYGIFTFTVAP